MKSLFKLALVAVTIACSASEVVTFATVIPDTDAVPEAKKSIKPERPAFTLSAAEMAKSIAELRAKRLTLPLRGINIENVKGGFYGVRGTRMHEAVDFMAPHGTPIYAVEDGTIPRFFESAAGGKTIYQVDVTGNYVYYYAHLQEYAANINPGDKVKRGTLIGFVGSTGNASPTAPHLHFSIGKMSPEKQVWTTASIDPYEVFARGAAVEPTGVDSVAPRVQIELPKGEPVAPAKKPVRLPFGRSAIWI